MPNLTGYPNISNVQTILDDALLGVTLVTADPSAGAGEAARLNAVGKATDGTYWIKVGALDTDWEQVLITTAGEFVANIQLEDVSGIVPADKTIGLDTNNRVVVGDGVTTGGLPASPGTSTFMLSTTVGEMDVISGDIPDNWKYNAGTYKGLVIGTSCTHVGSNAFYYSGSGPVVIPSSVTSMGNSSFGLAGFSSVVAEKGSVLGAYAFQGAPNLTDATLACGSIGTYAFFGAGLVNVTFLDGVETIGSYAFYNVTTLTNAGATLNTLEIPSTVTSIGSSAFYGCTGITIMKCYVTKTVMDTNSPLDGSNVSTIHARAADGTWSVGVQTVGGKSGINVIKDL